MSKRDIKDVYYVAGPHNNLRAGTGKTSVTKLYISEGMAKASMNQDKTLTEEDKIVTPVVLLPVVEYNILVQIADETVKLIESGQISIEVNAF